MSKSMEMSVDNRSRLNRLNRLLEKVRSLDRALQQAANQTFSGQGDILETIDWAMDAYLALSHRALPFLEAMKREAYSQKGLGERPAPRTGGGFWVGELAGHTGCSLSTSGTHCDDLGCGCHKPGAVWIP